MAEVTSKDNVGSQITQALSAGSGVNIQELATTLANAESISGISAVNAKKESTEVAISGYAVLKSSVSALMRSFKGLEDSETLLTKTSNSSNTSTVDAAVVSQSLAKAGTTQINVSALAQAQQNVIVQNGAAFASPSATIASGAFSLAITTPASSGTTTNIAVSTLTPTGIASAINAQTDTTGVTARLINVSATGTSVKIVLEGKTGAANTFAFSSNLTGAEALGGGALANKVLSAANLSVTMNGVSVQRDNNSPSDLVEGMKLTFKTASTANIVVNEDTSSLKNSLNTMIQAHNDFLTLTDYLVGEADPDDELAGSLSGEKSTINLIKNRIRTALASTSEAASNGIGTLRQIGLETKLGGTLSLKAATFDAIMLTNFDDIRTMLTADTNGQTSFSTSDKGLALTISESLDTLVGETGSIKAKETNAAKDIVRYDEQLVDLNERFESIKARYLKQFAAMETLVQRSKSTGEYLTGQFKAMEGAYSNN
ncbi:flagellar filament capping protein FliD [Gammaproteobacteria bacterium]|nr:flagellar filament capping protein FliD [Gammaproteobacteria bacterium]|tara:strand:+ start:544 stop:2004 length:1461 start_codon:yes stop_codon:yes gene_type:complete